MTCETRDRKGIIVGNDKTYLDDYLLLFFLGKDEIDDYLLVNDR